ncbi:MAG: GNAT family N-acetyltransferase [Ectothiorhodospiraceae bacterium]|nr:GNAT family N-acetyltransferase [Chromatiales bacterium]MCP5156758.1 GNAT family N-acetyltransferase [Ectothiorhodospiraceae bacterium]
MSPTSDVRIRAATIDDAEAIAGFNRAMARETEDRDLDPGRVGPGVRAVLEHPERGFYLVAEHQGRPVAGLMVTYEWSDWRNGNFWWLQSVYVQPDYRRQGLYRRLYSAVRERAGAAGNVCGFRLYVEQENARAQATYRALGMGETGYLMFEEVLDPVDASPAPRRDPLGSTDGAP